VIREDGRAEHAVSKYFGTHIYGTLDAQCASHVCYGIGYADKVAFTSQMMVPNVGRWNQWCEGSAHGIPVTF